MKLVSYKYSRHAGLGNKLFPWARMRVFSKETGAKPRSTLWFSPHGGGITRGGVDYRRALRKIWLFRNFTNSPGDVSWLRYWLEYSRLPKREFYFLSDALKDRSENQHVIFVGKPGVNDTFEELAGYQELLRTDLQNMAISGARRFVQRFDEEDYIALNVRSGNDFVSRESGKVGIVKTGLDWYCDALSQVRRKYGHLKAYVISDGGRKQLAPLLDEPNVVLCESPCAISDLLICAKAKVFLGCGNSSFSAWASFIGEMDTYTSETESIEVWYRGVRGRNGEQKVCTL